eukprot:5714318-Pyramimonas_sp.AAC.1
MSSFLLHGSSEAGPTRLRPWVADLPDFENTLPGELATDTERGGSMCNHPVAPPHLVVFPRLVPVGLVAVLRLVQQRP